VKVDFGIQGGNSIVEVEDTNGNLLPLGTINLGAKYCDALQFAGSMTSTGSTLTVTLGTPGAGTRSTVLVPTTMNWSSYGNTALESGLPDVEF
jgi:hypothetical protein